MTSDISAVPRPPDETDPPQRVSDRIRQRLQQAGRRFHANDNISEFVEDGELEGLQAEVAEHMQQVLRSLVIDVDGDHNTSDTAQRVARMFVQETFSGRYAKMPSVTAFPNAERLSELLIVGPITIRSACSHHLCPIIGKCWIGILPRPDSQLIGLSKYARLTEWIMNRPQIQEEAVIQLADTLESKVRPEGLAIVIEADHFCMRWRGVKDAESSMTNSVMRGAFLTNPDLRREFLSLLSRKNGR
jgi:GTP cyclohydrolase I